LTSGQIRLLSITDPHEERLRLGHHPTDSTTPRNRWPYPSTDARLSLTICIKQAHHTCIVNNTSLCQYKSGNTSRRATLPNSVTTIYCSPESHGRTPSSGLCAPLLILIFLILNGRRLRVRNSPLRTSCICDVSTGHVSTAYRSMRGST